MFKKQSVTKKNNNQYEQKEKMSNGKCNQNDNGNDRKKADVG